VVLAQVQVQLMEEMEEMSFCAEGMQVVSAQEILEEASIFDLVPLQLAHLGLFVLPRAVAL
jgi:hypothetical protein